MPVPRPCARVPRGEAARADADCDCPRRGAGAHPHADGRGARRPAPPGPSPPVRRQAEIAAAPLLHCVPAGSGPAPADTPIASPHPPLHRSALLPLLVSMLAACAPLPQGTGLGARWQPSPNFDARRAAFVVIHYTAGDTSGRALRTLTSPRSGVSAHYLIGRDGGLLQLVDERARAWHAGASRWGPAHDLNSASIGIELDNDGSEPYAQAQIDTLLRLLSDLRQRHRLPPSSFLGHSDVAPGRKIDPGPRFPWARLAAHGFGAWCGAPPPPAPAGFDALLGLRAIGYDTRDPAAALGAFRLRYRPWAGADEPIDADRDLVHCVLARLAAPAGPPPAPGAEADR